MRKINKIINIAVISMIIAVYLSQKPVYASDLLTLRAPLLFDQLDGDSKVDFAKQDIIEKLLLKAFYAKIPSEVLKQGDAVIGGKKYRYLYVDYLKAHKIGAREFFYRAGDIFIVDINYAHLVPETVKRSGVKLIYLDFNKDINRGNDKGHTAAYLYRHDTILALIALQQLDLAGKVIVDAGAGNGVIGIASIVCGSSKVYVLEKEAKFKELIEDNARINGVLKSLDFSYFGKTFDELYDSKAQKDADIAVLNISKFGIIGGQLADILSVFKCNNAVLAGGSYADIAEDCGQEADLLDSDKESRIRSLLIDRFFKPMNLKIENLVEAKLHTLDVNTYVSFILRKSGQVLVSGHGGGSEFFDILQEISDFGPQGKPSQASLERRNLLRAAYPEIARSITDYFEEMYPDIDFSSLGIIITAGGSTLTGVAQEGSDLDLWFLIDDTGLPERLKLKEGAKKNVALRARKVINRMIDERGLIGIRKLHPERIYGEKVWFLSQILRSLESDGPNRKIGRYNRPIANAFLVCYGPAESVRSKLLIGIIHRKGYYKKWEEIQRKWATYVNDKHVKRLGSIQGLNLKLPDLTTMLIIYNIPMPDIMIKSRKRDVIDQGL